MGNYEEIVRYLNEINDTMTTVKMDSILPDSEGSYFLAVKLMYAREMGKNSVKKPHRNKLTSAVSLSLFMFLLKGEAILYSSGRSGLPAHSCIEAS